ncbi:hypothetical protein BH10BAC2_BH10BAC2_01800 [soil metagenome]
MKYISSLLLFVMLINYSCKTSKPNDSVAIADSKNEAKADKGLVDKESADFLVEAADARMMDIKEGELALQRGTTIEIKNYGKLMIKDQALLLGKIKALASKKNIVLPAEISADKQDGVKDISSKEGKDFDDKFIKMMKIDHERDIKEFTKAAEFSDKDVSAFAAKYLSMIQSHLDKINTLNK